MTRPLKRNDVVVPKDQSNGFFYARVWRRLDADRVVIICSGSHVKIEREDDLERSDYRGRWEWGREPGNWSGKTPRWIPMTSLKDLKKQAKVYNPYWPGWHAWGGRWTSAERQKAYERLSQGMPWFGVDGHSPQQ